MNAVTSAETIDPILTINRVQELVGYSASHIYRMVAAGSFPERVRLGPARVGWRASTIAEWLNSRPLASSVQASDTQGRSV